MPPPNLKNCLIKMKSQNNIFTQGSSRQGWQSWVLKTPPLACDKCRLQSTVARPNLQLKLASKANQEAKFTS